MSRTLLLSGDRDDFSTLSFDTETKTLTVLGSYAAPKNASWVEFLSSQGDTKHFIGLSETEDLGWLYSFEINEAQKTCQITSREPTSGDPSHFTLLRDKSALALSTYTGGSITLYRTSRFQESGNMLIGPALANSTPEFRYKAIGHGPIPNRQRQCHMHQVIEDSRGLLYVPDLGSDCIWVYHHEGPQMEICGWLQCPPGTGPRHGVFNSDESLLYVIGELSHEVIAFDVTIPPAKNTPPIDGFAPNIIPPDVHPDHQSMMDSAEICRHPTNQGILYVTNRWECHIAQRSARLQNASFSKPQGDAIAIIVLSSCGRKVERVKHVRTNLDVIRGIRISEDGAYAVAVGQESVGVEIYEICGSVGDEWQLAAGLYEGLQGGIKHAIWTD